jgi:hypothetical protein
MQPEPTGDKRASELTVSPPDPTPVVSEARERDGAERPTLVLRPQIHWRIAGPALIVFGLLLLAVGRLRAAPFALVFFAIGAAFLPALWDRVDVGPGTIGQRSLRKHRKTALADVDTFRLRRIAFPLLQGIHRGYKIGRYWSIPLTLRRSRRAHARSARALRRCTAPAVVPGVAANRRVPEDGRERVAIESVLRGFIEERRHRLGIERVGVWEVRCPHHVVGADL